jgi:ribose-phosphate pyrophosphokinase
MPDSSNLINVPVGKLGIIPLKSCTTLGEKVDSYIAKWRVERHNEHKDNLTFTGYEKESYILESDCPRFGSGEAKGTLSSSVRGADIYLLVDVVNHSITYNICGQPTVMSPDDHYADLKRVIAAIGSKAVENHLTVPSHFRSLSRWELKISSPSTLMTLVFKMPFLPVVLKTLCRHISLSRPCSRQHLTLSWTASI